MAEASDPILWLDRVEGCPPARAGGKAARLAVLTRLGFPVPPGFVVGAGARPADGTIPPDLERAILAAHRALAPAGEAVAVRSSATAEDRPDRSFAGQYETFLDVRTGADLLRAVRACWAALDAPRARAYREATGVEREPPAMAVLVQRMAAAELAGVVFTVNPVTGARGELLINAAHGLGEDLVGGRITPDQYTVDRATGAVAALPAGAAPVLGPDRIGELVRTALDLEARLGAAQDIEWCWGGGALSILQARPVTALGPALPHVVWGHPANAALAKDRVVFWSNWNTRENMPDPLKPLAWSFFSEVLSPEIMRALWGSGEDSPLYHHGFGIDLVDGRAYWNMNLVAGHPLLGPLLMRGLKLLDQEAFEAFRHLAATGEFRPFPPPVRGFAKAGSLLRGLWTVLRFPWLAPPEELQRRADAFAVEAERFRRLPLEGRSVPELLAEVKAFGRVGAAFAMPVLLVSGKSLLGSTLLQRLARRWKDLPLGELMGGVPGNRTVETALELFRLSRVPEPVRRAYLEGDLAGIEARLAGFPEGRDFLRRLEAWLDRYGHRGTKDLDLGAPSWREDRAFVHGMLQAYQRLGPGDPDPLAQFEAAARRREARTAELERRLGEGLLARLLPLRRWLFHRALRLVHDFFPWRENEKFYGAMLFPGSRRILLEVGRRFAERGWLAEGGDVFFLTLPELAAQEGPAPRSAPELRALVAERAARWRGQLRREAPFLVRSDGRPWERPGGAAGGNRLKGSAASAGRATGTARILRDPAECARFGAGEILVAPTTEPGWAPLFLLARGLVMEVGGPICHGAIIAREYGIPAVVGVRGATRAIRDGDRITVDGTAGEVLLEA